MVAQLRELRFDTLHLGVLLSKGLRHVLQHAPFTLADGVHERAHGRQIAPFSSLTERGLNRETMFHYLAAFTYRSPGLGLNLLRAMPAFFGLDVGRVALEPAAWPSVEPVRTRAGGARGAAPAPHAPGPPHHWDGPGDRSSATYSRAFVPPYSYSYRAVSGERPRKAASLRTARM